jgi:hypothetical protein
MTLLSPESKAFWGTIGDEWTWPKTKVRRIGIQKSLSVFRLMMTECFVTLF